MQVRKDTAKADGFLNVVIVDANGHRHNFKSGIALHSDRKLDAMLLKDPALVKKFTLENIDLIVNPIVEAVDPQF